MLEEYSDFARPPDPGQAYNPFQASYFPDLIKITGY